MMNSLGGQRRPFLFIIDFLAHSPVVIPLEEVDSGEILFDINGTGNLPDSLYVRDKDIPSFSFSKFPMDYVKYKTAFDMVKSHFILGNTFLANLTFPTPITTSLSLYDMFRFSRARYRLFVKDRFVVFSPECFIKISGNVLSSYPMKGTIDAAVPDAARVILDDPKETAEHITIVDLIRNDIGISAEQVRVRRFRYIDTLVTSDKILLQVSSEITGVLSGEFHRNLGTLLFSMLPAGSITGAPKKKTVEIITEAEGYDRGYYTGVFGIFDGENLESAVMIRFI
ncbi:MAG: aminodeoxychorismate synthase component I, partial [Spirochaetales bacterium]|nr:aminodeoxychorismate synthase component I [Spirochaetales bacterium]